MKTITSHFKRITIYPAALLLALAGAAPVLADAPVPSASSPAPSASSGDSSCFLTPVTGYFKNWFERVSDIQAEQPHWVTPLFTVTPRLEEELRYDQYWESLPGGHTLDNYGAGKGVELIPMDNVEVIVGVPAWETEDTHPNKSGWADENFLVKYRLLYGNEDNGNYVLTAFMGLSVPNGSDDFSSHHFGFTPTIAFGKGWGHFDFQSTVGITIPDNGAVKDGSGTPLAVNTAFQYNLCKYLWPEVEANYTYYPNGEHAGVNQLFLTPGIVLGRFAIWHRVGVTLGAGYQVAVTQQPLIRNNFVFSARIPF